MKADSAINRWQKGALSPIQPFSLRLGAQIEF